MNDPNRPFKWLLVITMVVLSLVVLYPPRERLKGGIDLVGGTSLLYEIDTTGLLPDEQRDLSQRVVGILKERVDPQGQMNLEWRPVGATRLEVRMPRPPKEALERREAYNATMDEIQAMNITRRDVEEALNAQGEDRDRRWAQIAQGVEGRQAKIEAVQTAYAKYTEVQSSTDPATVEEASKAYEAAMSDLLATSLSATRLRDVLALPAGEKRAAELAKLKEESPAYAARIDEAVAAYDKWAENKAELEDPSDLKRRLRGAGVLEFRILAERDLSSPDMTTAPGSPELRQPIQKYVEQLQKSGPRARIGDVYGWFPVNDVLRFTNSDNLEAFEAKRTLPGLPIVEEYAGRYYVLAHAEQKFGLLQAGTGGAKWALKRAYPDRNPMTGENVVSFQLDPRGGMLFGELTGSNVGRQLCILLDGAAMSHARINERITEHCQISGRFTPEEVRDLVTTLEAGSLPARLKETPLYENTIGPSLGETNRTHGIQAAVWALVLVVVFVLIYYGVAGGGVASIALCLNLLFTLAVMSLMQATFTLPGIAGLLLSIGMAIDANVLIFERIREERQRGLPFKKALTLGYDKAFSAILDGNITTIITCVILGFVGSEEIKGFAITLGLGIATSMFTALTVTRLFYTQLVSWGILNDLRMMKLIDVPKIDWIGLRRIFWPVSTAVCVAGVALFLYVAAVRTESFFDIEFLGGTSVQLDLKPGEQMSDVEVREAITSTDPSQNSAVNWINNAAEQLQSAAVAGTPTPFQFSVTAPGLTGEQLAVLLRRAMEPITVRDGITASGETATFTTQAGTQADVKEAIAQAVTQALAAGDKLRSARVQTVGEAKEGGTKSSFEVVTVETNRALIQEAVLAAIGDKLAVQRALQYDIVSDADMTRQPYFVIEAEDQYVSDVLKTDAAFDIRHFRGGAMVEVALDGTEQPITVAELESRIREVGLQPEFEQFRTRDMAVFPLGSAAPVAEGQSGYKRFAVASLDETLLYEEDPAQWEIGLAQSVLNQVNAALGAEKSLSKVVQFAPQIAGQTTTRAIFATILAMMGIGAYVWFRFGTRDFGLAIVVTMVHDVAIVLGAVAVSHWLHDTIIGRILLLDDFRFDLTMLAAILTIIGYQLNDTIVVFDRIREIRGRAGTISATVINEGINQTMSRTILTATLVTFTVVVLYIFGGSGVHGFAYAMLVGTLAGTYSTVAIATPLVYLPKVLSRVMTAIVVLGAIGLVFLVTDRTEWTARLVLIGIILVAAAAWVIRGQRAEAYYGQPARA